MFELYSCNLTEMIPLANQDDIDLLHLLKQDVQAAFDEIYRRYWSVLYNAAYKRTRNREQCKDAVQNVFIDLWSRRNDVSITNLSAYLHTAVRFQVLKAVTRNAQQSVFLDGFENLIVSPHNLEDNLREKEILKLLELWLETLPERRRQIFILRYREGFSTREIAEKLGISQNTVQAQLYTATESLRERFAQLLALSVIISFLIKH